MKRDCRYIVGACAAMAVVTPLAAGAPTVAVSEAKYHPVDAGKTQYKLSGTASDYGQPPYTLHIKILKADGTVIFEDVAQKHNEANWSVCVQCVPGGVSYSVTISGGNTVEGLLTETSEELCSAIPTVTEWGLIVLTLLLLTAGTLIVGRQYGRRVAA